MKPETIIIKGSEHKIGHKGLVYYRNHEQWFLSTKTPEYFHKAKNRIISEQAKQCASCFEVYDHKLKRCSHCSSSRVK